MSFITVAGNFEKDKELFSLEKLSLEESKKQTKERRQNGLNMIRPFTFDERKILWDGLYNDGYKRKNI